MLTNTGNGDSDETRRQEVREVDQATSDILQVSNGLLDVIAVQGQVSDPGPSVAECSGKNFEKYFRMHHVWSVSGVKDPIMKEAMERLKEQLPKMGWEIVEYGPNGSREGTLELTAGHKEKKHSANVELWEGSKNSGSPMLFINVASSCYQVPVGTTVDRY